MENSRGGVAATWTVEAGAATRRMANMEGGPKEDDSRWCHGINMILCDSVPGSIKEENFVILCSYFQRMEL